MICLECSQLDLKQFPEHARVGLGKCNVVSMPGVFVSFTRRRTCESVKQADSETVEKRLDWWQSRKGK